MLALDAQMTPFAMQRLATEHIALGFNYAEVGAQLARRWHFPVLFVQVMGTADFRLDNPQAAKLADLIALASWQAWVSQEELSPDQMAALWPHDLAQRVGVSVELGGAQIECWTELCDDELELLI
jgi:HD-like signal output (HDOD) protein